MYDQIREDILFIILYTDVNISVRMIADCVLNAISSFLSITPQMLSKIRKDITFDTRQ